MCFFFKGWRMNRGELWVQMDIQRFEIKSFLVLRPTLQIVAASESQLVTEDKQHSIFLEWWSTLQYMICSYKSLISDCRTEQDVVLWGLRLSHSIKLWSVNIRRHEAVFIELPHLWSVGAFVFCSSVKWRVVISVQFISGTAQKWLLWGLVIVFHFGPPQCYQYFVWTLPVTVRETATLSTQDRN